MITMESNFPTVLDLQNIPDQIQMRLVPAPSTSGIGVTRVVSGLEGKLVLKSSCVL